MATWGVELWYLYQIKFSAVSTINEQWRNFGSRRPLAMDAFQVAPLKIFSDPLTTFGRKPPWKTQIFTEMPPPRIAGAAWS